MKLKQIFVLPVALGLFCSNCRYDDTSVVSSNIILHDKPLYVIRANIQGQWKLLYVQGGFSSGTFPAKNNPYLKITDDHIIAGNDFGVTLDSMIVWRRDTDIFNQYTYLMGTSGPTGYPGLIYTIVDRIKNDTLILVDNAYDGFSYYYLRTKQK